MDTRTVHHELDPSGSALAEVCVGDDHDYVCSDMYPVSSWAFRRVSNPLRVYWACRRCHACGAILFPTDQDEFERLAGQVGIDRPVSFVIYAEEWLRRNRGVRKFLDSPAGVRFGLEYVRQLTAQMEQEIDQRVQQKVFELTQKNSEAKRAWEEEREAERSSRRIVYFLRNPVTALVKIGFTCDLDKRMANLRAQGGADVELLGFIRGGRDLEGQIHQRWVAYRIRGEWFQSNPELMAWISQNTERYHETVSP